MNAKTRELLGGSVERSKGMLAIVNGLEYNQITTTAGFFLASLLISLENQNVKGGRAQVLIDILNFVDLFSKLSDPDEPNAKKETQK